MLIDFLTETISSMEAFRDDIATVYVFEETDHQIVATGNHPKMMVLYRVVATEDLSDQLEAPACLGALQYLRSLLCSPLMKEGRIQIEYQEHDGKKTGTRSMRFLSNRIDANFECTDPSVLDPSNRRTQFDKFKDCVVFPFSKEMRKEFDDLARMNTPKSDSRMFTLAFDGNYMRAIFGTGKHTTSLVLSDAVSGNTGTKIQKLLSLERFRPMIKLAAENNGQASFHEKAFWVDFETRHAHHTIVTPTIREQAR